MCKCAKGAQTVSVTFVGIRLNL